MAKMKEKDIDIEEILEGIINDATLDYLLDKLEKICYAKAEHVYSNFQDRKLGYSWEICGIAIAKASVLANKAGL
jgi:hypothetical protein